MTGLLTVTKPESFFTKIGAPGTAMKSGRVNRRGRALHWVELKGEPCCGGHVTKALAVVHACRLFQERHWIWE